MRPHEPFARRAADYDHWYDTPEGRRAFSAEVASLRLVVGAVSGRWTEVGVGTGRFATAIGIGEGVDPSPRMRAFALDRGVTAVDGSAEDLPCAPDAYDGVLLALRSASSTIRRPHFASVIAC